MRIDLTTAEKIGDLFSDSKKDTKVILSEIKEKYNINISASTISEIKKSDEERQYRTDTIIGIARYFNVSTDYLLGLTDAPIKLESEQEQAIRIACDYTGLNVQTIKVLHSFSENLCEFVDYIVYGFFNNEIEKYISAENITLLPENFGIDNEYLYNAIEKSIEIQKLLTILNEQYKSTDNNFNNFQELNRLKNEIQEKEEKLNGDKYYIFNKFMNLLDEFINKKGGENNGKEES